jgi:hypothetical protein
VQVEAARRRRKVSRWGIAALTGLLTVGGVLMNPAPALADPIAQPGSVTLTPGRRLIKVEWTAPSNPASPVSSYTATASTGQTCTANSVTLTCTIPSVDANVPITVSVRACPANTADCSAPKFAPAAVKAGPPATPPAPTVVYLNSSQSAMQLTWTEADEGAGIATYRVTPTPAFTSEQGTCTTLVTGTSCVVSNLVAGTTYSFKLTAIGINNATGSTGSSAVGPASTPKYAGLPATPTAPTITQNSNTAVTVSWTKPAGAGATIAGYTVQETTGGQSTDACTVGADATSCQVTGLDPTQSYTFKVRTKGEGTYGGNSVYSSDSAAITPGKPAKPDAPTVELGAVAGQVRVYWTPPAGGGAVTGYTVTPSSMVDNTPPGPCDVGASATYCDFVGLDDGVAYTFTVVAKGATNSDVSDPSDSIVSQLPTKPNTPTAELGNDPGEVLLHWTRQTTGGPVIFYNVTVVPSPGNAALGTKSADCGFNLTTPTCKITGLATNATYTFRVTAIGDLGSVDSDASTPAILPDKPGAPRTVVAQLDGPTTVTVTWLAPNTGGEVGTYTVTATASDGTSATGCDAVPASTLTCTISAGLMADKSYTFKVQANNSAGQSDTTATPRAADIPTAPRSPAVALTSGVAGSVDVSWTAPIQNVGTRYIVTAASTDAGATLPAGCSTTVALLCTVSGLTTTAHYTFTVRAENLLGGAATTATSAVVPAKPGAPGSVTVTVTGSGAATVGWAAPTTGGQVATYTVTANSNTGTPPQESPCVVDMVANPSASLSCAFTGMDASEPYQFTVRADNAVDGTDAAPTADVLPGGPGAPTNLHAVLGDPPGRVTVSWDAPAGAPVAAYLVTATSTDGGTTRTCVPATLTAGSCTFTNLTTTASYSFVVNAANAVGDTDSATFPNTPIVPDKPGAPGNVAAARGNAASKATITWDAPTTGGEVVRYTVTPASSDNAAFIPTACEITSPNLSTRSCDFTTLTASKPYTFVVSAINLAGHSNTTSTPALVPNKPDQPVVLAVTVPAPGSATVTWAAPTGAPVVNGWVVTPTSTDGGATPSPSTCSVIASADRTCTFTGLTTTASYSFTIRATNEAGYTDSNPTTPIVANKPGVPSTPWVKVVAGDRVDIGWAPPVGGGPITKYTVNAYTATAPTTDIASASTCTEITTLHCQFTGLSDTQTYTFRVTAIGPGGSTQGERSDAVSMVGPGKPSTPTVALSGPRAVTVTWNAPNTGGEVYNYSVTSTPDLSAPARCTYVRALTCVFDRLTSGTAYTFQVYANGTGDRSTPSDPSASIVPGPPGTMAAPTVVPTSATSVTVSWTAPTTGGNVAGYQVLSNTGNFGCANPAGPSATSCVVSGLNTATSYTFTVKAIGAGSGGDSAASPASAAIVPGAPAAPTDVEVTGADSQIDVSWTAPTVTTGITGYRAVTTPGGQYCTTTGTTATECIISGVQNLTSYTVTVTSVGTNVSSPASTPSVRVRPTAGRPGSPTAVQATAGNATAVVTWTAPTSVGNGIARYIATAVDPAGVQKTCASDGPAVTCIITGLSNNSPYSVSVVAVGRAASGYSPASTAVTVTPKLVVPPGVPTNVTVTPGVRSLTVNWTAGSAGDGLAGFTVVATPLSGTPLTCAVPATETSCTFSDVPLGPYAATVVARGTATGVVSAPSTPYWGTSLFAAAPTLPSLLTSVPASSGPLTSLASTATVGGSITITGGGFAPWTAVSVYVYSPRVKVATVVADATGAVNIPVGIPVATATGSKTIVVAGLTSTGGSTVRTLTGTFTLQNPA